MNSTLLKYAKISAPSQTPEFNIQNGNDAEILSASILLKAMGCEISWGSRNEDGRKIDLICSYDHPWEDKERLIFLVQVKSGKTYGRATDNGFVLMGSAKKMAQRTSHPICIIWVDRETGNNYWAYIHPFSTKSSQEYGKNHLLNPATRYDIARCQARMIPGKNEGSGITIKKVIGTFSEKRDFALAQYKTLKTKDITIPNLGKIEFTRIGWRHMFRKQRSGINKEKSIHTIPYLDKILEHKPTKIYITANNLETIREHQIRTSEYVLTYEKVDVFENDEKNRISVIVRVLEEIMWPENWLMNSMLSQLIKRRLVLLSAYYK